MKARNHRLLMAFSTLSLGLLVLSGCANQPLAADKGTPSVVAQVSTKSTMPGIPEIATVPPAIGTIMVPSAYPTGDSARPTSTEDPIFNPQGDDPQAKETLKKWQTAFNTLTSVKTHQTIMSLYPDGRLELPQDAEYKGVNSTDEIYDNIKGDSKTIRYIITGHTSRGDLIALYDGNTVYMTETWIKEIQKPWPDTSDPFSPNNTGEIGMANYLIPKRVHYAFVGDSNIDGHNVVVLKIMPEGEPHYDSGGFAGDYVFLDTTTYLPYRIIERFGRPDSDPLPAIERTFTSLEVNQTFSKDDFTLHLPDMASRVTLYVPNGTGTYVRAYASPEEAQADAGFTLFETKDYMPKQVGIIAYVEQNGKLVPIMSLDDGALTEGVYVPRTEKLPYYPATDPDLKPGAITSINGQSAEIWSSDSNTFLRMELEGTQIQIKASSQAEAIEMAEGLQQVK